MLAAAVTRRADAPIDVVWATITDIAGYPGAVRSYVRVEFLTPSRSDVGTSWRQTRTVFGREHAQVIYVTAWEPPKLLVTTASERGAAYTTTYRLSDQGTATEVAVWFEVEATNPVGRLVQRLLGRRLMGSAQGAMDDDLADLAASAVAWAPNAHSGAD